MKAILLTESLLNELQREGYRSLIAKGAPEEKEGKYIQTLLASKQEPHTEETAEATWQFSVAEGIPQNSHTEYWVERED